MSVAPDTWTVWESPLGPLTLLASASTGALRTLRFPGRGGPLAERDRRPGAFDDAIAQLEQYFAGERQRFELTLDLGGTPFQRAVWDQLQRIPYGTTISYSALAHRLGRPDRLRAVAAAVGRTPVPIVVPCHRVLGADGGLTGYGGGLQRKQALLELERLGARGLAPEPAWAFRQLALM